MLRSLRLPLFVVVALAVAGTAACATPDSGQAGADTAQRAGTTTDATRAVFGVRKPKHVGVATMTAREMLSGEAERPAERVAVVACGPAIRALAADSKFADRVRAAIGEGVAYKACGVTVERMGFDASRFIDGVDVVPNGFVEIIRLQERGFHSLEL